MMILFTKEGLKTKYLNNLCKRFFKKLISEKKAAQKAETGTIKIVLILRKQSHFL